MANISDINFNSRYQGYIWMSNSTSPLVINDSTVDPSMFACKVPFVNEAQLYDNDNKISVSIRFVDGAYMVAIYNIDENDISNPDNEKILYKPNRMSRNLAFLRYWEEETDDLCLNMGVLTFKKMVFIGFEKETK